MSPDCVGNFCVSRSTACWDSVPGVLKESTNEPPAAAEARAERDEDGHDDRERAFPMSRGRGGETSKGMSHVLHGITLRAKLQ